MNKRMKKKKETQLKEWAIKEGLFFFNKKSFVLNPNNDVKIYNTINSLPAGTKVLLSNNFKDWIEMGIGDKTEFNFYKSKKFVTTLVRDKRNENIPSFPVSINYDKKESEYGRYDLWSMGGIIIRKL